MRLHFYLLIAICLQLCTTGEPFQPNPIELYWTENWSHDKKIAQIWMAAIGTKGQRGRWPTIFETLRRFTFETDDFRRLQLPATFRPYSDNLKILHGSGSHALVNFEFTDNKYSGIFSDKSVAAIMTASTGNQMRPNTTTQFGWGFKFFRTNTEAAHVLTLNVLAGEPDYNMFKYMTCNHAPLSTMFFLYPKSRGWTLFPGQNGLSNVARANKAGEHFDPPVFPYALCFIPRSDIQERLQTPTAFVHPQTQLQHIPMGAVILDVIAIEHPIVLENPGALMQYSSKIGEVRVMSEFMLSSFIDHRLFIQHQAFEEDLLHRPDWRPYMTPANLFNEGPLFAYRQLYDPGFFNFSHLDDSVKLLLAALNQLASDPEASKQYFDADTGFEVIRNRLSDGVAAQREFVNSSDPEQFVNMTQDTSENIWPETPESQKLQQVDMRARWAYLRSVLNGTVVDFRDLAAWAVDAVEYARDEVINIKAEKKKTLSSRLVLETTTALTASIQQALVIHAPSPIKNNKCPFHAITGHGFIPKLSVNTEIQKSSTGLSTAEALNLIELVGMLTEFSR